jgi:hypothetical protein
MKKGVTLRVVVYVEGEDAPADDFARLGQSVIGEVLAAGIKAYTGPYTVAVRKVEALEGGDADDEE